MKSKPHAVLLTTSTFWCATLIAVPVFHLGWAYPFFSIICHQDPSRSWFILGTQLPVCARCASIYFGFLGSLWLCLPASVRWLRVSIVLTLAEFAIARFFIDSVVLRCFSGILLGIFAAPFVREGIEEMMGDRAVGGSVRANL